MPSPIQWQIATVAAVTAETPEAKTFTLTLPEFAPHRAGQHYDVRLTADDGYQAQRSYSIASAPERSGEIDLTVERIADGEVSAYMHDVLVVGATASRCAARSAVTSCGRRGWVVRCCSSPAGRGSSP
jgi:ferredoxin-NADP reductase